jgi:uncharacterized protein DUF7014
MNWTPYSKRSNPPGMELFYSFSQKARLRIEAVLCRQVGQPSSLRLLLDEVQELLELEYGTLHSPAYDALYEDGVHPVIEHLGYCHDDLVVDFLEVVFRCSIFCGGQSTVEMLNRVLREEQIGYELTEFRGKEHAKGSRIIGQQSSEDVLPIVFRIDNRELHQSVLVPALSLLTDSRFKVAEKEMHAALKAHREGRDDESLTDSISAFESLLKTVLTEKGWEFEQKDTFGKLIDICIEHQLFPSFYDTIMKGTSTIRNRLSDAHGRGPVAEHTATPMEAEHLLYIVAAHMLFIAKKSGFQ